MIKLQYPKAQLCTANHEISDWTKILFMLLNYSNTLRLDYR